MVPPLLYAFCQAFRFITLIMFTIFMVDCTVYHFQTSVNCKNFTRYTSASTPGCDAYCWKGLWILCSIITSSLALCISMIPNNLTEQLRPAKNIQVIQSLIRKPYFWYLSFIFILVMLYDALIETQTLTHGSSAVEVGVIVCKFLTLCLIFQLNFTYPPTKQQHSVFNMSLYYITLALFLLDNLCKFVELSIRVSYKLYSMNTDNHKQREVLCLMLEVSFAMSAVN